MSREAANAFSQLIAQAQAHIEALVSSWLPDGQKKGGKEWVARNVVRGDRTPGSFSINLRTGVWADFACEGVKGKDVISLYAYLNGCAMGEAAKAVSEQLGLGEFKVEREDSKPKKKAAPAPSLKVVATYDYTDKTGTVIFQAQRLEGMVDGIKKKTFRQRRPDGSGGWIMNLEGVTQVPYRLPELIKGIEDGNLVFIVEGEKDVNNLRQIGINATCNPMGAGKWPDELCPWFVDADVMILPDNDQAGDKHARLVDRQLTGIARSVRVLDLPGLPEKGDATDWIEAGGTAGQLLELAVEQSVTMKQRSFKSRFKAMRWGEIEKPGGQEYEWLIDKILTRQEIAVLAGATQTGKSFIALHMCMSIARGTGFMGHKALRGGIVYQAGEGGVGIKQRLRAYRKAFGVREDLPFVLLPSRINLYRDEEDLNDLIEECKNFDDEFQANQGIRLELIVIDTYATATTGADDISGRDVSVCLDRCRKLQEGTGAAVLLIHHLNAEGSRIRGHTSLEGNLENAFICEILMTKPEKKSREEPQVMYDQHGRDIREMWVKKQKDGKVGARYRYVLNEVDLGINTHGSEITSCVIGQPNIPPEPKDYQRRPRFQGEAE